MNPADGIPHAKDSAEPPLKRGSAFIVHILTASGAALVLLALVAAVESRWAAMFAWLGVALIVDAIDGPIARRIRVAAVLPNWSGETLDLVVDFLSYVFLPAFAIASSGLLPAPLALPAGIIIAITGALYFADRRMKTCDNYFRGFPAVWNVAAFYLFLLRPEPWIAAFAVAILAALTFTPVLFVHPFRVIRLRRVSMAVLGLWIILAITAVANNLAPGPGITTGLCLTGIYFFVAGALRGNSNKA